MFSNYENNKWAGINQIYYNIDNQIAQNVFHTHAWDNGPSTISSNEFKIDITIILSTWGFVKKYENFSRVDWNFSDTTV